MSCIPKEGKHLSFNIKWALDDFLFRHTQILLFLRSVEWWHGYISSTLYSTSCPFFEKEPNEIGSHLREKESGGKFFCTLEAQKSHWRRKRKGGNEKEAMVALIVFTITTLEIVFGRKILFDKRGPFGSNIFKNPTTHRIWENIKGQKTLITMPLIEKH